MPPAWCLIVVAFGLTFPAYDKKIVKSTKKMKHDFRLKLKTSNLNFVILIIFVLLLYQCETMDIIWA